MPLEWLTITNDDEETGEEREPTEQEIFEHITKDLSEGKEVYACMELSSDWEVQERAKTNLKTNFYVGQQVFLLRDNKIAEKTITRVILEKNEDRECCKVLLKHDSTYTKGVDVFATKEELVESLLKE
jgi:ATPase subunit of ABC transporter with duplicated ATPase domains